MIGKILAKANHFIDIVLIVSFWIPLLLFGIKMMEIEKEYNKELKRLERRWDKRWMNHT